MAEQASAHSASAPSIILPANGVNSHREMRVDGSPEAGGVKSSAWRNNESSIIYAYASGMRGAASANRRFRVEAFSPCDYHRRRHDVVLISTYMSARILKMLQCPDGKHRDEGRVDR